MCSTWPPKCMMMSWCTLRLVHNSLPVLSPVPDPPRNYICVLFGLQQFVNTELMVQAEPKILRGSRRSETVHSDKASCSHYLPHFIQPCISLSWCINDPVLSVLQEDDIKKKRTSSTEQEHLASGGKAKKRRNWVLLFPWKTDSCRWSHRLIGVTCLHGNSSCAVFRTHL